MTACVTGSTGEGRTGTQRAAIVGGQADEKHVAVLDILVADEQSCTGTLISPHVVLTAAHCIIEDVQDARELTVFTGPNEAKRAGGKLHKVAAGNVYPTWERKNLPQDETPGDLAVLILEEASTIPPMRYSRRALDNSMVGGSVQIIGYGDTTVKDPTTGGGTRKQANVPLISFDKDWVVVGTPTVVQCYGDSGGPVVMTIDGVEQVVGINSWQAGDDCNEPNHNTRVDVFAQWIDAQVKAADPGFDAGGDDPGADVPGDPETSPPGSRTDGTSAESEGNARRSNGASEKAASRNSDSAPGGCQMGAARADAHRPLAITLALLAGLALIRRRRPKTARGVGAT